MATTKPTPAVAVEERDFQLSLEEFCTSESRTDRRVELLGAFFAAEQKAGRVKDTPTAYRERLRAFATQPA